MFEYTKPINEWTDEELRERIAGLEGTCSGVAVVFRETLRMELEGRAAAPVRIVDLRIVMDQRDEVRVTADGRELVRDASAAGALRTLAERIGGRTPPRQLAALASNEGASVRPIGGRNFKPDNGPEAA